MKHGAEQWWIEPSSYWRAWTYWSSMRRGSNFENPLPT
ncbi:hypothetical protein [Devosia sp. DBB001]|nr:hypothetical protein [Devosia sp. DBB001]